MNDYYVADAYRKWGVMTDAVLRNHVSEECLNHVMNKDILDAKEDDDRVGSGRPKKELKLIRVLEEKRLEVERENRVQ